MDKRLGYRENVSSHSKKSKKRSNKKNNVLGSWMNTQNNQSNDMVSGMEYPQVLWECDLPQNLQNNRQRLFTTTSDPSMCGYTQMPMTYTMEPVSLPTMYRVYQPVPVSGIRTVHSRPGRQCDQNQSMNLSMNSMANGYTSLQENGGESPVSANCQNGDYTSLPSTANKNNGINGDEINSEPRRYSDPGLGSAEAAVHSQSEDSDNVDSGSSITTIGRSNKLVLSLIEQMTELKKSNNQLFNELNETKSEIGSMKAKLAVCSSSDYQPGMLSDFIREIRQANKTYEEVLVSKVKSMIEEKLNQRSLEVVNLNNQIMKLMEEKKESDRRIAKLEEEVATLKLNAKLEKLMDILHDKMIDATGQEGTIPCLANVKRARNTSSSSDDQEEDEDQAEGNDHQEEKQRKDKEDEGKVDEQGGTTYREKVSEWLSMIESGVKLSGPVTDL